MRNENDGFSQILKSQKKYKIIFVLILITWFINIGILGILRINIINLRMNEIMISDLTMDIQTHSYILHDSVDKYEETSNLSMKATYLSTINNSTSEMDLLMDFFSSVELEPQFTEMRDHVIDDWNLELKPTLDASIYFIDNNDPGNYSKLTHDIAHIILDIVSDLVELESYLDQNSIPVLTSQSTFLFYFSMILSLVIIGIVTFLGIMSNKTTKFAAFKLQTLNKELERSNGDLQQFAYVASHDLKAPLQTISGYLHLLNKNNSHLIDEKSVKHISSAIKGINRMGRLIDDLLKFSRVNDSIDQNFEPIDFNEVLDISLLNLKAIIEEKGAKISLAGNFPTISGDFTQLVQLIQNLIANAIKFVKDRSPEIIIGTEQKNSFHQFFVRDNGIGIEFKNKDKIFAIFQRLHSSSEYSGNGIGLAVCKKIVGRHGGQIWVESEIGKGSTFWFTIPKISKESILLVPEM